MVWDQKLQQIADAHLYTSTYEPYQRITVPLQLTRGEMRFLLLAMEHFREAHCPLEGKGTECPLLGTGESVHTGAVEPTCLHACDQWARSLLENIVPAFFPPRSSAGAPASMARKQGL